MSGFYNHIPAPAAWFPGMGEAPVHKVRLPTQAAIKETIRERALQLLEESAANRRQGRDLDAKLVQLDRNIGNFLNRAYSVKESLIAARNAKRQCKEVQRKALADAKSQITRARYLVVKELGLVEWRKMLSDKGRKVERHKSRNLGRGFSAVKESMGG